MEHLTAPRSDQQAPLRGVSARSLRRVLRFVGTLAMCAGVLALVWAVVVWQWQDPFTALYTHFQQKHLAAVYQERAVKFESQAPTAGVVPNVVDAQHEVRVAAARYRSALGTGDPVGRLTIGRIGLKMMVVQGTDEESLKKGPGHYLTTALPGQGHLIYVAGHRTTYLAPFSHIDDIRNGDYIKFELPYGTFTYRAFRHYVVPATDLAMLVDHGKEILRLQACHPRFFATHRYIVDARLVSFTLHGSHTPFVVGNS
jgi:sortase A